MTNFTTMLALRIIARTPRSWLTITAMPRGLGLSQGRLHLAAQRLGHLGRLEAARGEARDAHRKRIDEELGLQGGLHGDAAHGNKSPSRAADACARPRWR